MKSRLHLGVFLLAASLAGVAYAGQPAPNNTMLSAPPLVNPLPITLVGASNVGATTETNEPTHGGFGPFASVWWKWTPAFAGGSGTVIISTDGSTTNGSIAMDTILSVYEVTTGPTGFGDLVSIGENDDINGSLNRRSQVVVNVQNTKTYYICVDGFGSSTGTDIHLSIKINDDFADALALPNTVPFNFGGNNQTATAQVNEPVHAGTAASKSVWYTFTPVSTGKVTATVNCGFNSLLSVYTGGSLLALNLVAQSDNANNAFQSQATWNAQAGTTYSIAVDANGSGGNFSLQFENANPPANDDLANATALSGSLPISVTGFNVQASREASENAHAGLIGSGTVWWKWTSPSTGGNVTITTEGSSFDTLLSVYADGVFPLATTVASNDDFGFSTFSQVTFNAAGNMAYLIAVDGKNGNTGSIKLLIAQPPVNDDLANATVLTSTLPVTASGTNRLGSKEGGEPTLLGNTTAASVWWSWTAPNGAGNVTFSTAGSDQNLDTVLAVYGNISDYSGPPVAIKSNDNSSPFTNKSQVTFAVTPGNTYKIVVEGKSGQTGLIQLNIVAAVANDDFVNAFNLTGTLPITDSRSNNYASKETGEPNHGGANGGSSLWYKWTNGATPQKVVLSTEGSTVRTGVGVYTWTGSFVPTAFANFGNITSGGTFGNGNQSHSQVWFGALANTTYYFAVDSQFTETGTIVLTLTNPPANDDFVNATSMSSGLPSNTTGSNHFATNEGGEQNHDEQNNVPVQSSVWWSWTATADGTVTFTTTGSDFNTVLAVYTGVAVNNLQPVGKNNDLGSSSTSQVTADVQNGKTYMIAVDGYYGAQGNIALRIESPPANDDFANASVLSSTLPAATTGSNVYASKEQNEPDHAASQGFPKGGSSVWWKWTAASTTKVTVTTGFSGATDFNSLLAVYTGTSVSTLTLIAANNDFNGSETSTLTFQAVSGTTYYIAVDGQFGASGNIGLDLRTASAPANDDFANATVLTGSLPIVVNGDNTDASKEAGEPIHDPGNFDTGGTSVWWSWVAPSTTAVTVSTAGSDFSTLLGVYIGNSVATLTPVARTTQGQITFNAAAGSTYKIVVDGSLGSAGGIQLSLATAPANDNFANAEVLPSTLPIQFHVGSTVGATKENNEPYHGGPGPGNYTGNFGGASVWYSWKAERTETVTITTIFSDFDTLLGVYTGTSVSSLTYVAGNNDTIERTSSVSFSATAGTTYRIAVDGYNNNTGAKTGAISLSLKSTETPDLVIQSITHSPTNPNPGQSVTFTVTLQNTTTADIGLVEVGFYQNLAVAPDQGTTTSGTDSVTVVPANSTADLVFTISAPSVGTYTAWAFADRDGDVSEIDEDNNAGPVGGHSWTVVPLPPSVTSTLTASGTVGSAFTYTITGSNNPTSYNASGLPAGLSVNTTTGVISGTPTATGTTSVTISATNAGGTGTATLAITVNPAAPAITSAVAATGVQGTAFSYAITTTGTAPITLSASNLPSGLSLSGSTIAGTPTVFGTFVVTLTATNGAGSDSVQLTLTIGDKTDNDNDGFTNEQEAALGTNANDATSTPFNGAAAGTAETLGITALKLSVNSTAGGGDSIGISGFFAGTATSFDGQVIVLDVGGVVKSFTLNAKGQSPKANDTIKVTSKSGKVSFAAKLSKGSFASSFEDEGLTGTNAAGGVKTVRIDVLWANKVYRKDQFISVSIKSGKVGGGGLGLDSKTGLTGRSGGL